MLVLKYWLHSYKPEKSQICEALHTYLWSGKKRHIKKTDYWSVYSEIIQSSSLLCSLVRPHKNCGHSIGTHFEEAVVIVSVAILPIKAANKLIMGYYCCIAIWLFKMQVKIWLTLCSWSFSKGNSDIVTSIFAYTGDWYIDYELTPLHSNWIIQDARPKIVDALLMLNVQR